MTKTFFRDILECIVEDETLFGADAPCPISYEPGAKGSKLLIVTGENASGKSLVLKAMSAYSKRESDGKVENMLISMNFRTESGFQRAVVYGGSEEEDSTGTLSVNAALGAIHNSSNREGRHLLLLDEPDIGLSEGYQAALGEKFHQFMLSSSKTFEGLAIATHSRPLVKAVMSLKPHCMRVGDDSRSTETWIKDGPLAVSVKDLESLHKRQIERWRRITALLRERNKK